MMSQREEKKSLRSPEFVHRPLVTWGIKEKVQSQRQVQTQLQVVHMCTNCSVHRLLDVRALLRESEWHGLRCKTR